MVSKLGDKCTVPYNFYTIRKTKLLIKYANHDEGLSGKALTGQFIMIFDEPVISRLVSFLTELLSTMQMQYLLMLLV